MHGPADLRGERPGRLPRHRHHAGGAQLRPVPAVRRAHVPRQAARRSSRCTRRCSASTAEDGGWTIARHASGRARRGAARRRSRRCPTRRRASGAPSSSQALLDLYGEGLARIVDVAVATTAAAALADDELVAHLLLLHGLHPVPVEERVRGALDEVRPYLESHGGDVELLGHRGRRRAAAAGGHLQRLPVLGADADARDRGRDRAGGARHRARSRPRARDARPCRRLLQIASSQLPGADGEVRADAHAARARGRAERRRRRGGSSTASCAARRSRPSTATCSSSTTRELSARAGRARCCSTAPRPAADTTGSSPDRRLRARRLRARRRRLGGAAAAGRHRVLLPRRARRARASRFYPSPMGATESLLGLDAWERLEAANPVLGELEPDVEALLVNRARGARGTGSCRSTTATRSSG